jgi:hypothetical protein
MFIEPCNSNKFVLIIFLCIVFFFFVISRIILKYTVKIIYYFDVRVSQSFILVAEGEMNEKRTRITVFDIS